MIIKKQLKKAGSAAADLLDRLEVFIKAGISGEDVDRFAEDYLDKYYPGYNLSCKGYGGFPASVCVSVNECIIHGVPDKRKFNDGDIVKVDLVVDYKGWFADTARTYIIGRASPEGERLVETTKRALYKAIDLARPGNTTGDIGYVTQQCAEREGFSVIREYSGHGIGRVMHADPGIPNFGTPGEGERLKEGMVLAIETMFFAGAPDIETGSDGMSVKARDGSLTAHFEHTLVVTGSGPVIITCRGDV